MVARKRKPGRCGAGLSENVSSRQTTKCSENTTASYPTQTRSVYAGLTRIGDIVRTPDGWLTYRADGSVLGSYHDIEEARTALREPQS